jgi:hypothetical protein
MYLRLATEPCLDFLEAAKEEFKRVESGWGPLCWYVHRGFYHRQLMPYYDAFGAENIRVYLSGDLKRDPVGTMQDMFRFLGVDDTFVPDTATDYNAGTMPKSFAVHHFLMKENAVRSALAKVLPRTVKDSAVKTIKRMNSGQKKSGPSPEARSFLIDVYREDILKLQDLIQRDLTAWLTIDKKERDPSDAPS